MKSVHSLNWAIIAFLSLILLTLASGCEKSAAGPDKEQAFQNATEDQFDVEALEAAFERAEGISDLRSLAVSRDFQIVAEAYFNGADSGPDSILHVMSVTKSVTATLVGIAIDRGFIESVDVTLSSFLGPEVDSVNAALGQVTLHQLLTMSCGHEWAEITEPSEFADWVNSEDMWRYIFDKPIVNTPGTVFDYSDGAAHLVSIILEKATGMNTSVFADQYLWGPMGLGQRLWYHDNRGTSVGGVGLIIGAHDMIAFGNLYLNLGKVGSMQIVPEAWIDTLLEPRMPSGDHIAEFPSYGYYWWLKTIGTRDCCCAIGYGGQFIFICPDFNLVVAATCDYRGKTAAEAGQNWQRIANIILDEIFPAVR